MFSCPLSGYKSRLPQPSMRVDPSLTCVPRLAAGCRLVRVWQSCKKRASVSEGSWAIPAISTRSWPGLFKPRFKKNAQRLKGIARKTYVELSGLQKMQLVKGSLIISFIILKIRGSSMVRPGVGSSCSGRVKIANHGVMPDSSYLYYSKAISVRNPVYRLYAAHLAWSHAT